jgi:pimeloyl-ACP methyl ester carboxylesterase
MSQPGQYLALNGISLYYEVHGAGEPLLLLHGGGGSAAHFERMLPALTQHFQVITPDSRAQGRSTDSDQPLSYRQLVEDMVGLLDALGMAAAYVGGWSDGAAIALHLALYHPQRVRALVLTPVDLSAEALTAEFWQQAAQWQVPEKLITWWRTRTSPTVAELQSIRAPTLIVAGEREQFIQHAHFAQWQHVLPNAELVWIPAADHALVLTHPDEVNQAILSFLRKHR